MTIGASFNSTFQRSLEEIAGEGCVPISEAVTAALSGGTLAFPGHRSRACRTEVPGGRIEILVYAMAGSWPDDAADDPARIVYWASLGTSPDRLRQDLAMFEAFLRTARIGHPG